MSALITDEQRFLLLANGRESLESLEFDPAPVVKLFTPDAGATWLLAEIDPDDHDHAFGLCDPGLGKPELGWVSLQELATVRGRLGLPVERDFLFRDDSSLALRWTALKLDTAGLSITYAHPSYVGAF